MGDHGGERMPRRRDLRSRICTLFCNRWKINCKLKTYRWRNIREKKKEKRREREKGANEERGGRGKGG